jgi:hypothetical protein
MTRPVSQPVQLSQQRFGSVHLFPSPPPLLRLARVADTLSQPGTIGRLSQVIDRWIYTACLCFGLDLDEQTRSGFGYAYSVYQVEYSRNLIFASGAVMDRVFDTVVDRTRTRLDVAKLRTLFGVGHARTAVPALTSRPVRQS